MKKLIQLPLLLVFSLLVFQCSSDDDAPEPQTEVEIQPETVTDADGNVYETITMGNQIWMKENLKTTKYNDGVAITQYTFAAHGNNWGSLNNQEAFYRWADTSDLSNIVDEELTFDAYGAMYNHFAIESGKLAPAGWRIPTEADFLTLESFIANDGNSGHEATVLKTEAGWSPNSGNGTNVYGFNAVPNGYVSTPGTATLAHGICTWATTNVNGTSLGSQTRRLVQLFDTNAILYGDNPIQLGAGIRCIKIQ
ncbi:fibrobacter succinogenes major paralogous domain-containing protein [Lacinutrix jangbogonensis]|uniref:fibrobacter succinogenes major paralogous domain-containing protein n=1 Tax=Lacinutrix jangbogonensis TaxID=1469557 RepID=UPI00068EDADC|nr:fibrobacter succinogenes major paralogous domain-containing protein [Lacinutrix jangbogonensis]